MFYWNSGDRLNTHSQTYITTPTTNISPLEFSTIKSLILFIFPALLDIINIYSK